ncbi:transposase [Arthrobacter rhombi]|uniref:transposase n=1 Tax=Arthrobacter rhombi TaxID=71253 RepID=UPI003FD0D663
MATPRHAAHPDYEWSPKRRIFTALGALTEVTPNPASSGNKTRQRLNLHGDRHLNRALHTIARTRMMFDAATMEYVERRTAEGKSNTNIHRCLKQLFARQLFRKLGLLLT